MACSRQYTEPFSLGRPARIEDLFELPGCPDDALDSGIHAVLGLDRSHGKVFPFDGRANQDYGAGFGESLGGGLQNAIIFNELGDRKGVLQIQFCSDGGSMGEQHDSIRLWITCFCSGITG